MGIHRLIVHLNLHVQDWSYMRIPIGVRGGGGGGGWGAAAPLKKKIK